MEWSHQWTLSQPCIACLCIGVFVHVKLIHTHTHSLGALKIVLRNTHVIFRGKKVENVISRLVSGCIWDKIISFVGECACVSFLIRFIKSRFLFRTVRKLNCQKTKNYQQFNHFVIQIKYWILFWYRINFLLLSLLVLLLSKMLYHFIFP